MNMFLAFTIRHNKYLLECGRGGNFREYDLCTVQQAFVGAQTIILGVDEKLNSLRAAEKCAV